MNKRHDLLLLRRTRAVYHLAILEFFFLNRFLNVEKKDDLREEVITFPWRRAGKPL